MAPFHIRQYQERDRKRVLDLFSKGMEEHIPATFYYALMLPRTLLLLLGVPFFLVLVSDFWVLAILYIFCLLLSLWLLARSLWRNYVDTCLHTDMADITKSYLMGHGSCFWVAESGGQVAGIVGALPVKNPQLGRKQLQLFRLSVSLQHRGLGIAKALVRTVLQFARDQGYSEVVLYTGRIQHSAVAVYQNMGFQEAGTSFLNLASKLLNISVVHFRYPISSVQKQEL